MDVTSGAHRSIPTRPISNRVVKSESRALTTCRPLRLSAVHTRGWPVRKGTLKQSLLPEVHRVMRSAQVMMISAAMLVAMGLVPASAVQRIVVAEEFIGNG